MQIYKQKSNSKGCDVVGEVLSHLDRVIEIVKTSNFYWVIIYLKSVAL